VEGVGVGVEPCVSSACAGRIDRSR
jgi:hypothetical protein